MKFSFQKKIILISTFITNMKQSKKGVKIADEQNIESQNQSEIMDEDIEQEGEDNQDASSEPISIIQNPLDDEKELEEKMEEYREKQSNKGVCYMSRIPPYMKPNYIKKLLDNYLVERIYLLPQSDWTRKNRIKRGGNKKICFRQGWVQFSDKRMAKLAALTLNGQKMVGKKGNFYSEDLWNLKYLPKFKWHHLTERLAHEQRLKRQRLKVELEMEKKVGDFYEQKIAKSKMINGIQKSKIRKGKDLKVRKDKERQFSQIKMVAEIAEE